MRILFQSRPKNLWQGGDMFQLEKTMEALKKKGIQVDFSDQPLYSPALGLRTYDIVHLWNFSMPWTKYQLWAAKKHHRKTVCSMIYHEGEEFLPYTHQQIMWDHLDAPIFLAKGEYERVKRHIQTGDKKVHYIPNGLDEFWFDFPKKKRDYILTVGRIEETKGQLAVAKVCKKLGLKYVVVGESKFPHYEAALKKEGAKILAPQTPEELKETYSKAKLLVLASRAEVFPLTAMEAGAQALNIVMTDHCEWKDPTFEWCEWDNEKSIEKAIKKALKKPPNTDFQTRLKEMTWPRVCDKIIDIYADLLSNNSISNNSD